MGLMMGIFIFSAAGIPPTAGFLGKFYIFRSAIDVGMLSGEYAFIWMVVLGVLTSVAGAYYYLKVLVFMYMKPSRRDFRPLVHPGAKFAIVICAILTIYLGLFPGRAIDVSREAVMDFQGAPAAVQGTIDLARQQLEVESP
ncbi:MAG: proton-conducting transporter membrane subunit [Bradymonadaceae bacterium]